MRVRRASGGREGELLQRASRLRLGALHDVPDMGDTGWRDRYADDTGFGYQDGGAPVADERQRDTGEGDGVRGVEEKERATGQREQGKRANPTGSSRTGVRKTLLECEPKEETQPEQQGNRDS